MKNMNDIILMNFTGTYKEQQFYRDEKVSWVEVQELSGCNCYCDEDAVGCLEGLLKELPEEGVHFFDSGNYHYMTLLWLKKIQKPFSLLVFDNHTDMQPPAFGGLLSCGGWAAAALEELPFLNRLILVGPDQEAYDQTDQELRSRVVFLSREQMQSMKKEEILSFFKELKEEYPLYISVDKDVLCPSDASTDWSQGDMKLAVLEEILHIVYAQQEIIGMDVCGECDSSGKGYLNDRANKRLLEIWKNRRSICEK